MKNFELRMKNGGAGVVVALVLVVSCGERGAAPPAVAPARAARAAGLLADKPRYTFVSGDHGPEVTIVTTFIAPQEVFLVNCNGAISVGVQRREGDGWVNAWIGETNACLSPAIVLARGARHTATVTVIAERGIGGPLRPGTYRAAWFNVLTSFDRDRRPFGDELPLEQRVSAPFVIE